MLAFLNQVRKPTLDLPLEVRRKMWFKPFMQSYLVVFIGYLTMYLIRKNFNIAQNDMISTYGLSMTQLGMIGLGFSITYGVGKTLVSYYADGKNTKQFLPFMLILSAICMLGSSARYRVLSPAANQQATPPDKQTSRQTPSPPLPPLCGNTLPPPYRLTSVGQRQKNQW